jgi:CDP-diglyceride synthetase
MFSFLAHIGIVLLPLIIANVLHMMVVKIDFLPSLKHPISQQLFGSNKTWRGFVVVPLLNAFLLFGFSILFKFQLVNAFLIGFVLGCVYMLSELPNSYMKRRLGIPAGAPSTKYKILFMLFDKMDAAFGVVLTHFLLGYISLLHALLLFVISSCTHILFSQLLVQFHLKKSF